MRESCPRWGKALSSDEAGLLFLLWNNVGMACIERPPGSRMELLGYVQRELDLLRAREAGCCWMTCRGCSFGPMARMI